MTFEQAKKFKFNPFDLTKVWPHKEFPLIDVGELVLNKNPQNYFAEIEQLAFCPATLVPGIQPSPDRMLQGRLFSYHDTQRHRLGANFHQIPVNKPQCPLMHPTIRDGPYCSDDNSGALPNYWPNSFLTYKTEHKDQYEPLSGDVDRHDTTNDDNYEQVTDFWLNVLKEDERERLVQNIVEHMKQAHPAIQERAVKHFERVHSKFGEKVRSGLNLMKVSKNSDKGSSKNPKQTNTAVGHPKTKFI